MSNDQRATWLESLGKHTFIEETKAMSNERKAAWVAALERYQDGYGSPFECETDSISSFLEILEGEVRTRIEGDLEESFRDATARLRSINVGG